MRESIISTLAPFFMIFDKSLLDDLTAKAKLSPRHRQHFDLRDSEDDIPQKMLNAIEPEAILTIHKHPTTAKLIVLVRGSVRMNLYDNDGNVIRQTVLRPEGGNILCSATRCLAQSHMP